MKKVKVLSPDECIKKFTNWFKEEKKIAFITAFITGLIVHFQLYSQELTNTDGLWNSIYYISGTWEMSLGRWGIVAFDTIRKGLVSPIISTTISIFFMSIVSVILVRLFDIKGKVTTILIAVATVAMPTLAATLPYFYCSDSYTFAILLAVLSVYFVYKMHNKVKGTILGVIVLALSMSLYQCSIGIATTLCLLTIIREILKNDKEQKEILKQIGLDAIMIVVAGILYFALTKIILKKYGITLADYGGASSVGIMSIFTNLFTSIKNTYTRFIQYYFSDSIIYNWYWNRQKFNFSLIVISIVIIVFLVIKEKIYKKKINLAILLLSICVLPIFLGVIEILTPERTINLLMATPYFLLVIFGIYLLEFLNVKENNYFKNTLSQIFKWATCIVTVCIIVTWIFSNNASYMAMKLTNNRAYSYAIRAIDRIETNEEYVKDMPVMFAGAINREEHPRSSAIYIMGDGFISNMDAFWTTYDGANATWTKFLNNNLGLDINWCSDKQYMEILETEEFKDMGVFPNNNSVKVINGIMVVKFTNNPAKVEI